jgi:hypothetical protein
MNQAKMNLMKTMKNKISSLTPLAIGALIGALFMADTRVCLAAPVVVVNTPVVTVATPVAPPPVVRFGTQIVVPTAPPPIVVEKTIPTSPGAGYAWIGGAWTWNNNWTWQRGHWDRPPHPGQVWVPHHYSFQNGRRVYTQGGWK